MIYKAIGNISLFLLDFMHIYQQLFLDIEFSYLFFFFKLPITDIK